MTDYVKSTSFASKDALPSGNPLKIVKGTEIDTEFNNIAVAVATKADLISPVLSGTPQAPTASLGTNTTQLATTAFVLQHLYPVGSVYINAGVTTNPALLFGFGTWVAFGAGRVMVGLNGSDVLFDALEETGGSKDAIVVSHTHTATVNDPGHVHGGVPNVGRDQFDAGPFNYNATWFSNTMNTAVAGTGISVSNSTTGSSGTNANLQPYITVAMWKRTA